MKLACGVYYRKYGDRVYLRNTWSQKDYLMNASAFEILQCLSDGERSVDEILVRAAERLPGVSGESVRDFLEQLGQENLLQPEEGDGESASFRNEIMEFCTDAHQVFSAALELTYRCNERCIHCYVDDAGCRNTAQELSLEEYEALLEDLRQMGCMEILLTGGEVCLKKEFLAVAERAAALGMLVNVYTNGYALTDQQFDALCGMNVNSLSFSLYGGTAAVHDRITGVPGSFDRTLRAIMMTKCAGIDTYIKTVAIRENADDLEALFQLGNRLRIPVSPAYGIIDTHLGQSKAEHRLMDAAAYRRIMELKQRYQPEPRPGGTRDPDGPVCNAGQCTLSVNPYGDVYPCLSLPVVLGNVRERPIREIWRNTPELERVRRLRFRDVCPGCGDCRYFSSCTVCLGGTGYLEGCADVLPPDACLIAEAYHGLRNE